MVGIHPSMHAVKKMIHLVRLVSAGRHLKWHYSFRCPSLPINGLPTVYWNMCIQLWYFWHVLRNPTHLLLTFYFYYTVVRFDFSSPPHHQPFHSIFIYVIRINKNTHKKKTKKQPQNVTVYIYSGHALCLWCAYSRDMTNIKQKFQEATMVISPCDLDKIKLG